MQRILSYDYLYLIPLTVAAFISVVSFWKKWAAPFRLFSVFLLSTWFIECFAIAWKWELYHTRYWSYTLSNLWIYNGFVIVRQMFLLVFFHGMLTAYHQKKAVRWFILPFAILACANYAFIQTPFNINTYTIAVANTMLVFLSLAFFHQVLMDKKIIVLYKASEFWIMLGIFFYYSGTLPFFLFFDYLTKQRSVVVHSYLYINDSLNLLMYTFFIIAYLCKPQIQKYQH